MEGRREQVAARSRWRSRDCCTNTNARWKARFAKFGETLSLLHGRSWMTRFKGERGFLICNFSRHTIVTNCCFLLLQLQCYSWDKIMTLVTVHSGILAIAYHLAQNIQASSMYKPHMMMIIHLRILCCTVPSSIPHTHNHFTALWILSGITQVSWYQKKHSPTHTSCDHQPSFISFLHLLRYIASSLFNLRAWQSFCTTSVQVFFGLVLGLAPSTSYSIHFFTQSLSSFHSTCPYHRILLASRVKNWRMFTVHKPSWWQLVYSIRDKMLVF